MLTFINKYWKTAVVGATFVLLTISIYLIIQLKKQIDANISSMESLNAKIENNTAIYNKNKELIDLLEAKYEDQKVIVVTTKEFYERIKKTPINGNITDVELLKQLKEFESKHNIK